MPLQKGEMGMGAHTVSDTFESLEAMRDEAYRYRLRRLDRKRIAAVFEITPEMHRLKSLTLH